MRRSGPCDAACAAGVSDLAGSDTIGDVELNELGRQLHCVRQTVDDVHAVQADFHGDERVKILSNLTAGHDREQALGRDRRIRAHELRQAGGAQPAAEYELRVCAQCSQNCGGALLRQRGGKRAAHRLLELDCLRVICSTPIPQQTRRVVWRQPATLVTKQFQRRRRKAKKLRAACPKSSHKCIIIIRRICRHSSRGGS